MSERKHRAVEIIAARILDAMTRDRFVVAGYREAPTRVEAEASALKLCVHIERVLKAYNVVTPHGAVMGRIAAHWSLEDLEDPDGLLCRAALAEHEHNQRAPWPTDVTIDEIATVIERADDDNARVMAASLRAGQWETSRPGVLRPRDELYTKPSSRRMFVNVPMVEIGDEALARAWGSIFDPRLAAWIAHVEKAIRTAQRIPRQFAIPTHRPARAVAGALSAGGKPEAWASMGQSKRTNEVLLRVVWAGRTRPYQLSLLPGSPHMAVVREVLEELRDDGLRDWLTLHRMAAEQGRAGRFMWTWPEHRRGSVYEARVRNGKFSNDTLKESVVKRLWRLSEARLQEVSERGEWSGWQLVGGEPLLTIEGELRRGEDLEAVRIRINPALYDGAHRDSENKHFSPVSESVLSLPGPALRLAAMLTYRWRDGADGGGVVEVSESELHFMAGTHGGKVQRANITHARKTLHRALDAVAVAHGAGCSWVRSKTSGEAVYTITPPTWWTDAVVHRVAPELPPTRSPALPRTGAALRLWREARGLSQAAVAATLGVERRTIIRAEQRGTSTLPTSLLEALPRAAADRGLPAGM